MGVEGEKWMRQARAARFSEISVGQFRHMFAIVVFEYDRERRRWGNPKRFSTPSWSAVSAACHEMQPANNKWQFVSVFFAALRYSRLKCVWNRQISISCCDPAACRILSRWVSPKKIHRKGRNGRKGKPSARSLIPTHALCPFTPTPGANGARERAFADGDSG